MHLLGSPSRNPFHRQQLPVDQVPDTMVLVLDIPGSPKYLGLRLYESVMSTPVQEGTSLYHVLCSRITDSADLVSRSRTTSK